MQKQGKDLAAVHNKPEPPKTRNISVPRKVKVERSDITEVDFCDILILVIYKWYLVNPCCPAFAQVSEFNKF